MDSGAIPKTRDDDAGGRGLGRRYGLRCSGGSRRRGNWIPGGDRDMWPWRGRDREVWRSGPAWGAPELFCVSWAGEKDRGGCDDESVAPHGEGIG